jgi:hypothetical protein
MHPGHIDIKSELEPYLQDNELLLWTGMPKQGFMLRKGDWIAIPFSLFWGGFAIAWEFSVLQMGDLNFTNIFALFGIPFVLIGIYMLFGRFFFEKFRRKNILYGMTSDRLLIRSGIHSKKFNSIQIKALRGITYSKRLDGSGTIVLGTESYMAGLFRGTGWPSGSPMAPVFELIPNVEDVYKQIVNLQRSV